MADLSEAQRKRAEARQRRRKQEPESTGEDDPAASDGKEETPPHGVRQAAKVAAAVGAAGAAAAAAKALTSHSDAPEETEPENGPEPDEPQRAQGPEPATHEHETAQQDETPPAGAGQADARRAIERAREQLEDLLGRPVETVSSLERTHDGWVLALDVVDLRRIPDSTDVLASYEMELDDNLDLRRYQQVRRYHRGRVESREEL